MLHRYAYAYDAAGNRTSEQIDTTVATETPNVNNQVTGRTGGGTIRVAGYLSKIGTVTVADNPAQMTTTTNFVGTIPASVGTNQFPVVAVDLSGNAATNWYQLTVSANGLDTSFTYDLAGNQLTKSNSAGVLALSWDGADRCSAITNGNLRTAIAYDGASRWSRITEYANDTLTADRRFIWNGTTLAEERDSSGSNVVQRFFANGFQRGGTNYFYVKDHLGSIREVYDQNGVLQARFEYDPYGRRTQTYGTLWVDFGFAGQFHHMPSGTAWAVFRIYQPDVARWANRDPIREHGGLNIYAYCGNNALNRTDTTGLSDKHGSDLNLFNNNPWSIGQNLFALAEALEPVPDVFVVSGHGFTGLGHPDIVDNLTPIQLADAIRKKAREENISFSRVRLAVCYAGREEATGYSKAQELANILQVRVDA